MNPSSHESHHYSNYPSHSSQSIGSHHGAGNPGIGVSDLYQPSPARHAPPPPPSNSSIPSLPSMRTIDALPPPPSSNMHSSPYPGPPNVPSGPLPFFSMPPPYGIPPHGLPSFSSHGHHHYGHMNDLRMPQYGMGGLRHKKEIKRRTKTGCMTCRKRRIKCDETHPTCNNCKKSKRDCAGYDPIFKQQPNNPAFMQATAHIPPHNGSSTASTSTTTSSGRSNSPPPAPYSSFAALSSSMASTAPSLSSIKSPSILGGPSSHSSAPSSSGSAASSNYYGATGPSSSSSNSSYQSNPNASSMSNGSCINHHSANSHNGHSSHTTHTATSSAFNPSTYSSRSIVSPPEYSGSSYDSTSHSYKDEPRRDYWADRSRPAYASSASDSRDLGRYGQSLM